MRTINRIFCSLLLAGACSLGAIAQENQSYFLHTIEKGQSLYSISSMYGVTQSDIVKLNPGSDEKIFVGRTLRIPRTAANTQTETFHTIAQGETLYRLTVKYGVSAKAICDANPGLSAENFRIGQVIRIPSASEADVVTTENVTEVAIPTIQGPVQSRCRDMHKVKRKETVYSISREYGISEAELIAANPELQGEDKIKKGTFLCIPYPTAQVEKPAQPQVAPSNSELFSENKKETERFSTIKAALILPFLDVSKSEAARMVEYYEGFLMAVDSLKRSGVSIDLYTYNSGPENASLNPILSKKEMKDMEVSVIAKVDNTFVAGHTFTDENGNFQLPVTSFEGEVEAVFQIRRRGSKHKKDASVMLDRNFAPTPRAFSYEEEHPQWMDKNSWITLSNRIDSLYVDSISKTNNTYLLSEVEIAKKRKNKNITTQVFEKSVDAYYDVTRLVDELRDQGIVINTIPDLLSKVNPNFSYDVQDGSSRYKEKTICLIVGKQVLDTLTAWTLWNEIDGIKQIMICEGSNSYTNEVLNSIHGSNMTKGQNVKDMMTAMNPPRTFDDSFYLYGDAAKKKISLDDTEKAKSEPLFRKKSSGINNNVNVNIDFSRFGQYALFYITPHFNSNYSRLTQKSMKAAHGTRRTIIQGYSRPLAFYSPVYKDKIPTANVNHRRRTLYWNPTIQTDKNGKISIECQNGMYANPIILHAEMLKGGIPCSITIIGEKKKK